MGADDRELSAAIRRASPRVIPLRTVMLWRVETGAVTARRGLLPDRMGNILVAGLAMRAQRGYNFVV